MSEQTVLFDAPGPRAMRRYRIMAGVGGALSLAVLAWVLAKLGEKGNLSAAKWSPFVHADTWTQYIIPGLIGTLKAAAISIVLASVLGLLLGTGRLSAVAPVRWVSSVVVEFFRAVPVLLMMLFTFALYSTNNLFPPSELSLAAVVTGLTLYNGAVIAELVRAGVGGLPAGQREAGLSVGLTEGQTLRAILLPQALTAMLPALVGQLVVVLKDSALGYVITYEELLNKANQVGTSQQNVVPAFLVVAVLFIVINYGLTRLAGLLERQLRRRGRTTGPIPGAPGAPGQEPVDLMRINTETG
jgi:glutamate transport system permease protein